MLLTKTVFIKWNPRNKMHYVDLGYSFTKMGNEFEAIINDITKGADIRVDLKCDYCGRIYDISWNSYIHLKEKENNTDCCNNPQCTGKKAQESMFLKYGVNSCQKLEEIKEKTKKTNLKKYGSENPFGSKKIQSKIRRTNLEKYGVEVPIQNPEIREKGTQTCLKKYGVTNYGKIYSETHRGKNSSQWKGGVKYHRVERSTWDYRNWRKSVFERDFYTCQCCGKRNGKGNGYIRLEAHHIVNWKNNKKLRYEINNGITLCQYCHKLFHSIYGLKNNTKQQLDSFITKFNEKNR